MRLPTLIGFHDPGRAGIIRAGKFVQHDGKWVYVYDIRDRLQFIDGFGVAPCVLRAMEENGIEEVHFVDRGQRCTWITEPETIRSRGFPFQGKRGRLHSRGTYLHLPLKYWTQLTRVPKYPWLRGPMEWLDWIEPESIPAMPQQGLLL